MFKTIWVVSATGKEDNKYRPLDQIKGDIRQLLEKEKRVESFDQEIGRLKEEYKVTMNDEFFKDMKEEGSLGENIPSMEQQEAEPAQGQQEVAVKQTPRVA